MREVSIQSALLDAVTRLLANRDSTLARVYRSLLDLATRHHAILIEEPLFGAAGSLAILVAAELLGAPVTFIASQPDFLYLASDGLPISKEFMQETTARLGLGATSERRVVIWEDINRLNTASANAFLKTLEEPDSRTIFLLTTPNTERMLPTILSRTITVQLTLPMLEDITKELVASMNTEKVEKLSTLALNRPALMAALLFEMEAKDKPLTELLHEAHAVAKNLLSDQPKDQLVAYSALLAFKDVEAQAKKKTGALPIPLRPLHLLCFIVEGTIEKMLHSSMISPLSQRPQEIAARILRFRQDIDQNMSLKLAALDLVFGTTNDTFS